MCVCVYVYIYVFVSISSPALCFLCPHSHVCLSEISYLLRWCDVGMPESLRLEENLLERWKQTFISESFKKHTQPPLCNWFIFQFIKYVKTRDRSGNLKLIKYFWKQLPWVHITVKLSLDIDYTLSFDELYSFIK